MLAAYSLGLLPSTSTRIYQSAFFALRDTKTPARVATLRVIVAAIVGAVLMVQFEPITKEWISIPGGIFSNVQVEGVPLGPVGLALGSALGAWLEWALLRRSLKRQIGAVGTGASQLARMFGSALAGAVAGYSVRFAIPAAHPIIAAVVVATVFGAVYFAVARMLGLEMARTVIDSALRRIRRR
jgi:putative peptidoglycan lipid II flippase